MKSIQDLEKKLSQVRKTEPNFDGDETEQVTQYLKFASDVLSELKRLPYFKKRPGFKKEVAVINTKVDELFYKITELSMQINH